MAAKIVLTIGERKLEFTPQEAREVQKQLAELIPVPLAVESFGDKLRRNEELELERLRKERRDERRQRQPPPEPIPYSPTPFWWGKHDVTCSRS